MSYPLIKHHKIEDPSFTAIHSSLLMGYERRVGYVIEVGGRQIYRHQSKRIRHPEIIMDIIETGETETGHETWGERDMGERERERERIEDPVTLFSSDSMEQAL